MKGGPVENPASEADLEQPESTSFFALEKSAEIGVTLPEDRAMNAPIYIPERMEKAERVANEAGHLESNETGASDLRFERAPSSRSQARNPGIHPRNIYATEEPNFAKLAAKDAKLRPFVTLKDNQRGSIDFTSSDACRYSNTEDI